MTIMSTYDIEVVTNYSPTEFVQRLFKRVNIDAEIESIKGMDVISTASFEITAFADAEDALTCELDIDPNVFIAFRPRPTLQTDILAVKHLLEAVNQWLHMIDNDFAMVHNGESVMMYRQAGQLYVNAASKGWTPSRLSLLTYPYEEVQMPPLTEAGVD